MLSIYNMHDLQYVLFLSCNILSFFISRCLTPVFYRLFLQMKRDIVEVILCNLTVNVTENEM